MLISRFRVAQAVPLPMPINATWGPDTLRCPGLSTSTFTRDRIEPSFYMYFLLQRMNNSRASSPSCLDPRSYVCYCTLPHTRHTPNSRAPADPALPPIHDKANLTFSSYEAKGHCITLYYNFMQPNPCSDICFSTGKEPAVARPSIRPPSKHHRQHLVHPKARTAARIVRPSKHPPSGSSGRSPGFRRFSFPGGLACAYLSPVNEKPIL